ncbi:hypothetical protein EDC94DRAFT_688687 [Helicostylum pulchrum]|nr:hypothetical protein EDC94DRAFT_688687 [Helicostylum pulchrum]
MSTPDEVVQLRNQLKEYESKLKSTQEKLKEEHGQLINYQKKLAQAGSHLKTLAGDNSNLTKQAQLEKGKRQQLETKQTNEIQLLETKIKESQQGHQKEVLQLVELLEKATLNNKENSVPDVSTSALLDSYIKSVQKRIIEPKNTQDEIAKLKKEIQDIKAVDHIEIIETSLQNILQDPENGTVDTSIPPSLLLLLEQLRTTLQEQQQHIESTQSQSAEKELKRQITQLNISLNELNEEKEDMLTQTEQLESKLTECEAKLKECQAQLNQTEKEKKASQEREKQLSKEHQSLLGKLHHIKETLTPRLEQDKQLRQKVNELTHELEITSRELERSRSDMMMRDEETSNQIERQEHIISQLSNRLENTQREREEYEVMAMQLDAQCSQIQDQLDNSNNELEKLKEMIASEQLKHESERSSLANLQSVLEEFQATKDAEMQAAVEHIERQLAIAKKSWKEYEERAHAAEAALEKYQNDVGKTQKYEQEIKEKNLLIGKLRHEAIILNEHLVEAMRKLKEETSEDNVDRQLISNLLVGFFLAPRGDRKRFDILTIISSVLHLSEEEKEQIGLTRPKVGTRSTIEPPQKESFTDAWISFLLKESSPLRRNRSAVTLSNTKLEDDSIDL